MSSSTLNESISQAARAFLQNPSEVKGLSTCFNVDVMESIRERLANSQEGDIIEVQTYTFVNDNPYKTFVYKGADRNVKIVIKNHAIHQVKWW